MLKIGDFSKICNSTIKTIRFYEKKGLLIPAEIDAFTGYRYYDESSFKCFMQISYLKEIGFSLKEIRDLNDNIIAEKAKSLNLQITKIKNNLKALSSFKKDKKGDYIMKPFINDERVIGKWKLLGAVKTKQDFYNNKIINASEFIFKELYFLEKGVGYWTIDSWRKGFITVKNVEFPYEIENNTMFLTTINRSNMQEDVIAVYERVDNKKYTKDMLTIEDDISLPFVEDERAVGFWKSIDFVKNIEQFSSHKKLWKGELFCKKLYISPDGSALITCGNNNNLISIKHTKGYLLDEDLKTASAYIIKTIASTNYLFVEWKSGDYSFGGLVNGLYVYEKIK